MNRQQRRASAAASPGMTRAQRKQVARMPAEAVKALEAVVGEAEPMAMTREILLGSAAVSAMVARGLESLKGDRAKAAVSVHIGAVLQQGLATGLVGIQFEGGTVNLVFGEKSGAPGFTMHLPQILPFGYRRWGVSEIMEWRAEQEGVIRMALGEMVQ